MTASPGNPFEDHEFVVSYEGWHETAGASERIMAEETPAVTRSRPMSAR